MWFILLRDHNRSSFVRSEETPEEIIKKNYIKGFENIENSGEFSYFLPQDDVNNLLDDGVKQTKDKHIESIYFEYSKTGQHVFYVDLKNTFIKTRVVVTTNVSDYGYDFIDMKIISAKIGKVECLNHLVKKGYLTSSWLNKYFKESHLPFTFDDVTKTLKYKVTSYEDYFPKTKIGTHLFNLAKQDNSSISINPATLGFSINFSKLRSSKDLVITTYDSPVPNFYNELDDACKSVNFLGMNIGDSTIAYSLSENDFGNLLKSSIKESFKEELSYGSNKVTFNLVDAQPSFKDDKMDVSLIYSLNGYLVDSKVELSLIDSPGLYFNSALELSYENQFSAGFLEEIFENVQKNQPNFFDFSKNQGELFTKLSEMNNNLPDGDLKKSWKRIEINSLTKTLDFIVQKTV